MKTDTIKQSTIRIIKEVLHKNKKFYISSDFPFTQLIGLYLTYQAHVMNEFLRERGFTIVRARDIDLKRTGRTDVKVRANRNIWIKTENFINYKK
jgi:hypothetical protein